MIRDIDPVLLFMALVGTFNWSCQREYKSKSTPGVNSNSLLTLTSLGTGYSLSFILDVATTLFVLTTEHTEHLHRLLNRQHLPIRVTHLTKMRRYDIVFGILLTLPIINFKFALAAPVLVQEKLHACVDAVHSPKDVVTVLEKRVEGDDIWKLLEDLFEHKLPDAHAASSSAPLGPDHGSKPMADVPVPTRNLASSTANPDPLMGPPSLSPTASSMAGGDSYHELVNQAAKFFKLSQKPIKSSDAHTSSSPAPLSWPNYPPKLDVQPPTVNPASGIELGTVGRYFYNRIATLDGFPKPPRKNRKRPRPKKPGPPTVPEQEVGTAPLPNPSSPIELSD